MMLFFFFLYLLVFNFLLFVFNFCNFLFSSLFFLYIVFGYFLVSPLQYIDFFEKKIPKIRKKSATRYTEKIKLNLFIII